MKQPVDVTAQFEKLTHTSPLVLEAIAKLLNSNQITADQVVVELNPMSETLYNVTVDQVNINLKFVLCSTACHLTIYEGAQVQQAITVGRSYPLWEANELNCVQQYYDTGKEILTFLTDNQFLKYIHDQDLDLLAEHGLSLNDFEVTTNSGYNKLEAKLKELRKL